MLVRGEGCYDPDPLDLEDFGFLDLDPQKHGDPRIRIQGVIINQNMQKKLLLLWAKSELLKKRDCKNFLISEWFISFRIKICEKNIKQIWKKKFIKKIQ